MEMNNLARDAMLAKQAGLSYGQWKAMQPPQEENPEEVPDGWLVCEYCGKQFKPKTKRPKRFCEVECQKQAYKKKYAEYMRNYRERKTNRYEV